VSAIVDECTEPRTWGHISEKFFCGSNLDAVIGVTALTLRGDLAIVENKIVATKNNEGESCAN